MTDDMGLAILQGVSELREKLHEYDRRMDDQDRDAQEIKASVGRVEKLAIQTNGRVRGLELWQATLQGARSVVSWVWPLVIAILATGVGALVATLLN